MKKIRFYKKLFVFASARSDFGILSNLIIGLEKEKYLELIIVTHNAHKYINQVNALRDSLKN